MVAPFKSEYKTVGSVSTHLSADCCAIFERACRIHTSFMVGRYLMSCADGREDGVEKALRHRELCSFYVALWFGLADPEGAARERPEAYKSVHSRTQELTDYLDEVIGFPLRGRPDFDALAPKFFARFHVLAMTALVDLVATD